MSDPKLGVSAKTLRSISTPDRVESRLGTLEFEAAFFDKSWRPSEIEPI